jgi:hypothetical protein
MARKSSPPAHPIPSDVRAVPLHDAISRQAEKLWKRYGSPQGRDDEIWLEAEGQVLGTDRQARQVGGGAVPAEPLGDVLYPPVHPHAVREPADEQDERREGAKLPAPGADTDLPK